MNTPDEVTKRIAGIYADAEAVIRFPPNLRGTIVAMMHDAARFAADHAVGSNPVLCARLRDQTLGIGPPLSIPECLDQMAAAVDVVVERRISLLPEWATETTVSDLDRLSTISAAARAHLDRLGYGDDGNDPRCNCHPADNTGGYHVRTCPAFDPAVGTENVQF